MVTKIRQRIRTTDAQFWAYVVEGLVAGLALLAELLRRKAERAGED